MTHCINQSQIIIGFVWSILPDQQFFIILFNTKTSAFEGKCGKWLFMEKSTGGDDQV